MEHKEQDGGMRWWQSFHGHSATKPTENFNRIANLKLKSKCCHLPFLTAPGKEATSYLFSMIPHFNVTKELFRTGGEIKFEREAKHVIYSTKELQAALYFPFNLYMEQTKIDAVTANAFL